MTRLYAAQGLPPLSVVKAGILEHLETAPRTAKELIEAVHVPHEVAYMALAQLEASGQAKIWSRCRPHRTYWCEPNWRTA